MIVGHPTNGAALAKRVEKHIGDFGGVGTKVDALGKKKLTYLIKKQTEGDFFVFNFEGEGTIVKNLVDKLRLEQEDLLRFLILTTKAAKVSKNALRKKNSVVLDKEEGAPAKVTVVTKATQAVVKEAKVATRKTIDEKPTKKVKKAVAGKGKKK